LSLGDFTSKLLDLDALADRFMGAGLPEMAAVEVASQATFDSGARPCART
jgi:hypothetical protein